MAEPQRFRPGMGISVTDKLLNSGWDISVTTIKSIEGNLLRIDPDDIARLQRRRATGCGSQYLSHPLRH